MQQEALSGTKTRLLAGLGGVLIVMFGGGLGYYFLGHGEWPLSDCLYMTAITISTVGFSEVIDVSSIPGGRLYTTVLILSGMGVIVYFASMLVALVVEGEIKQYFWRKKMSKHIQRTSDHIIICGAGGTGTAVIREFLATRTPFVVIDECADRLQRMIDEAEREFPYIIGDAADDSVLTAAGIGHARGLIAALPEDKDNLFVVISARQLNPGLRIVSRGVEASIAAKLQRVGADAVVSPNNIGGMRMASEMIRPHVVQFLDLMLKDQTSNLRVEEVTIGPSATVCNQTLGAADIARVADVLVVAARSTNAEYHYNPSPDFVLSAGATLIVLGPVDEVITLRKLLS